MWLEKNATMNRSHFKSFLFFILALLDLCCCAWAFSSCVAPASHCCGFSCCRAWALGHMSFPGPGIELLSPALAGGFLTTEPPRKSSF